MAAREVRVTVESTANGDNPGRPLFRAEAWDAQSGELVEATAWTVHPRAAIRDANDLLAIHRAWEQLRADLEAVG